MKKSKPENSAVNQVRKKAVIYCRVSSIKQSVKGDGVHSQQARCEEYAKYKGYELDRTFSDDMTGSSEKRPGMQSMLAYLRANRRDPRVVIIDDISRLARGVEAHIKLRTAISKAGAALESPSIEFGEDSDSVLVENLLASVSQHHRQKNSEQTVNRMRSRLLNGYWVFQAPLGYRYEQTRGRGKVLVRDEPVASIIAEMLERFASGSFQLQAEAQRFLESNPDFPSNKNGKVRATLVTQLLTRVLYAGHIESPDWGVSLRPGQHDALISFETFQRIQERLKEKPRAPARANLDKGFSLRGFVTCSDCGRPLTSCKSRGRHGAYYPYYLCYNRPCPSYGKSIRRDDIEGQFADLLRSVAPNPNLLAAVKTLFETIWNGRSEILKDRSKSLEAELLSIDRQIAQYLERVIGASSQTVISAYEKKIDELERTKIAIRERVSNYARPVRSFEDSFRNSILYLARPHLIWLSGEFEDRQAVLKLTFANRLGYDRNSGFRTPELSLPFSMLGGGSGGKSKLVGLQGFEPRTKGL